VESFRAGREKFNAGENVCWSIAFSKIVVAMDLSFILPRKPALQSKFE